MVLSRLYPINPSLAQARSRGYCETSVHLSRRRYCEAPNRAEFVGPSPSAPPPGFAHPILHKGDRQQAPDLRPVATLARDRPQNPHAVRSIRVIANACSIRCYLPRIGAAEDRIRNLRISAKRRGAWDFCRKRSELLACNRQKILDRPRIGLIHSRMYVALVPNRSSPPAYLLRESYREGGKVRAEPWPICRTGRSPRSSGCAACCATRCWAAPRRG